MDPHVKMALPTWQTECKPANQCPQAIQGQPIEIAPLVVEVARCAGAGVRAAEAQLVLNCLRVFARL